MKRLYSNQSAIKSILEGKKDKFNGFTIDEKSINQNRQEF